MECGQEGEREATPIDAVGRCASTPPTVTVEPPVQAPPFRSPPTAFIFVGTRFLGFSGVENTIPSSASPQTADLDTSLTSYEPPKSTNPARPSSTKNRNFGLLLSQLWSNNIKQFYQHRRHAVPFVFHLLFQFLVFKPII
jgi:hypothetical protein